MQAVAGKPSRPALPNSCTQDDKSGGKPCQITRRMFFLLIPKPNALVATITKTWPSCQELCESSLSLSLIEP